jgi:hypothetical protein
MLDVGLTATDYSEMLAGKVSLQAMIVLMLQQPNTRGALLWRNYCSTWESADLQRLEIADKPAQVQVQSSEQAIAADTAISIPTSSQASRSVASRSALSVAELDAIFRELEPNLSAGLTISQMTHDLAMKFPYSVGTWGNYFTDWRRGTGRFTGLTPPAPFSFLRPPPDRHVHLAKLSNEAMELIFRDHLQLAVDENLGANAMGRTLHDKVGI